VRKERGEVELQMLPGDSMVGWVGLILDWRLDPGQGTRCLDGSRETRESLIVFLPSAPALLLLPSGPVVTHVGEVPVHAFLGVSQSR